MSKEKYLELMPEEIPLIRAEIQKLLLAERLKMSLDMAWAASLPHVKRSALARADIRRKTRLLKELEEDGHGV